MNTTALYTADKCQIWCPTQNGEAALAATAEAAGLPVAKCDVIKVHLGGGFGRRGFSDYVTKAVLVAKEMPGTPVKLLWSREEDMAQGPLPPGDEGAPHGRPGRERQPGGPADPPLRPVDPRLPRAPRRSTRARDAFTFQGYWRPASIRWNTSIANLKIDHAMRNTHVPPGFWRGVNINQNAIFLECFMDELAEAAGQDPLEFRRKLMSDRPEVAGGVERGRGKRRLGQTGAEGPLRGLSHFRAFGSYVAALAEISVKDGNKVKVHKIVAATDTGYAVNPAQIERQIAGSFVYGLSALFMQGVHCQGRRHRPVRTSTTTTRCAWRRCRRSSRS